MRVRNVRAITLGLVFAACTSLAESSLGCTPDDYQQLKDEVEIQGREAMLKRYCTEYQLWKAALNAEVDFSTSARSRAEAKAEQQCRLTTLDRMRTALRARTAENLAANCSK